MRQNLTLPLQTILKVQKPVTCLLLLICCLVSIGVRAQLHTGTPGVTVTQLSYLAESDSNLTVQQFFDLHKSGRTIPLTTLQPNFGRSYQQYWIYIQVHATHTQQVVLQLSNAFLYQLQLYDAHAPATWPLIKTGIDYRFAQRPIPHRLFALPLTLQKGNNEFVLLTHRRNEVLRFSMQFYTPVQFTNHRMDDAIFFGLVFGVLAFIALFSIGFFVVLKDKVHLWYSAYIFLVLLFIAADNGFGYQWWWGKLPFVQKHIRSFLGLSTFAMHLRFMQAFLAQRRSQSALVGPVTAVIKAAVVLLALLGVSLITGRFGLSLNTPPVIRLVQWLSNAVFLSGIVLLAVSIYTGIKHGQQLAKIYGLAMLPMIIQMLTIMAARAQLIKTDIDTPKLLAVAILIEVIVLGCGLVYRYSIVKRENNVLALQVARQQQTLMEGIIEAQDNERKRIAEDLHDHLGGTLSAVKGMLSVAPQSAQINKATATLDEACNDLRFIAHGLMPTHFSQTNLARALCELVQKANDNNGSTRFQFVTHGKQGGLQKTQELALFRMANEMVQNIIKHAGATEATVQLLHHPDAVQLMVEDNGCGFEINEARASGIGLKNLFSRAQYLNADLCYDSCAEGTTIICTVPLSTG